MPDVSKHEAVLQGLKNGTYRTLDVTIGSHKINAGEKIPKADTQSTPTIAAPPDLPQGTYTVIALDLDAPFISFNLLSPIAHWIHTGFKKIPEQPQLESAESPLAPWAAANPPPGAAPHRYVFMLFEQKKPDSSTIPADLKDKSLSIMQRVRFDLDAMVEKLGLGEIVAANYFESN